MARVPETRDDSSFGDDDGVEKAVVEAGVWRDARAEAVLAAVGKSHQQRLVPERLVIEAHVVVEGTVGAAFADADDEVGPPAAGAGAALVEEARNPRVETDAADGV